MGFDDLEDPQWDTWRLDQGATEWTQAALSSSSIQARGGFASCLLGDSAVVSGGYAHLGGELLEQKIIDTGAVETPEWRDLSDVEERYSARSGATMTTVASGKTAQPHTSRAYLFGGFADYIASNQLYQLSYDPTTSSNTLRWSEVNAGGEVPPGRSAHAAVSLEGPSGVPSYYIFGGFGAEGSMNDLWLYQDEGKAVGSKWNQLEASNVPSPRSGHSIVACDEHRFLMFGGVGESGENYNDIHMYNAQQNEWVAVECPDGPGPRYNHRAVVVGDSLVLTGGCVDVDGTGMGSATGECYALDLAPLL
jgi:hypothetical protein